jgi:outer membrane protein TolC
MKHLILLTCFSFLLNASQADSSLSLEDALKMLKSQNLEIKAAQLDEKIAVQEAKAISGMHWGKLNFTQDVARSNDAGNVFGFKLTSREATFGDFGAEEFMNNLNAGNDPYSTPPEDLNYPDDRNFFQSKLRYEVPLFTGFAISSYSNVLNSMKKIKSLEKEDLLSLKRYELKKSFYDMALLDSSIENLTTILNNIGTLEKTTESMIEVGYAKHIDLLEVKAKKGNVERLLGEMRSNKELLYHYISFLLNTKVAHISPPQSEMQISTLSDAAILKQNLDIKKASLGLVIRESMLEAKEAAYYPTVGAFAEIATADDSFLGDAGDHKAYTVGARLQWNLFNGGIDAANIEKSKLEHLKMQTQVDLAKQGIALKLAKIRTQIKSSDEKILSLKKELAFANAIYKNYEGRYKEKLSSMSDVIIKQSAQIEKILQLQIAKNQRNEKVFALEKLANGGK